MTAARRQRFFQGHPARPTRGATAASAKKTQDIVALLGEKEIVAFATLKLQAAGLPDKENDPEYFRLVLRAMMTACVFTSSDRARALLYDVLRRSHTKYRAEIQEALDVVTRTFANIEKVLPPPKTRKQVSGIRPRQGKVSTRARQVHPRSRGRRAAAGRDRGPRGRYRTIIFADKFGCQG